MFGEFAIHYRDVVGVVDAMLAAKKRWKDGKSSVRTVLRVVQFNGIKTASSKQLASSREARRIYLIGVCGISRVHVDLQRAVRRDQKRRFLPSSTDTLQHPNDKMNIFSREHGEGD